MALGRGIGLIPGSVLDELDRALTETQVHSEAGSRANHFGCDVRFHDTIISFVQNELLMEALGQDANLQDYTCCQRARKLGGASRGDACQDQIVPEQGCLSPSEPVSWRPIRRWLPVSPSDLDRQRVHSLMRVKIGTKRLFNEDCRMVWVRVEALLPKAILLFSVIG